MRFKDEFLSHVSHELRSPLTAIKQFTTILLGGLAGELNREQREYQEIVLKNIRQLQSMIDDLLEVTRLETGKLTVEPESVSVADAVTDTLNTLQVTARAKGVALSCRPPADLPSAHADRTRLRQILDHPARQRHQVHRLRRYGHDSGPAAAGTIPGSCFSKYPIPDAGSAPEIRERIFERLYQVSGARPDQPQGPGTGLVHLQRAGDATRRPDLGRRASAERQHFSFTLPVFSLNNVIAPLLKNDKWPAESVALVMVESSGPDGAGLPRNPREEWSREARGLAPALFAAGFGRAVADTDLRRGGERFFVAAFAHESGASVLANRIREQFERPLHLKQAGLLFRFPTACWTRFLGCWCVCGADGDAMATSLEARSHHTSFRMAVSPSADPGGHRRLRAPHIQTHGAHQRDRVAARHRPGLHAVVEPDVVAFEPVLEMHVDRARRQLVGDRGQRQVVGRDEADRAAIQQAPQHAGGARQADRANWCRGTARRAGTAAARAAGDVGKLADPRDLRVETRSSLLQRILDAQRRADRQRREPKRARRAPARRPAPAPR